MTETINLYDLGIAALLEGTDRRADVQRAIRTQLGVGDATPELVQFIYTAKKGGRGHAMRTCMWFLLGESFR